MASKIKDLMFSVGEEQGIEELLRNAELMSPKNLEVPDEEDACRKNVGEQVRLQRYNRGIFAACSGGGHIWSFDVLYNSEGPTQVIEGQNNSTIRLIMFSHKWHTIEVQWDSFEYQSTE